MSPLDQRLIASLQSARAALVAARVAPWDKAPFNTVVLPPSSPNAAVPVYFLAPQTSNDAVPLGGHYEVDVDAAGKAGRVRAFAKSCLTTPTIRQCRLTRKSRRPSFRTCSIRCRRGYTCSHR